MVWMETLNLRVPETTEEYRNVLRAFRDGDPNRNGRADEIPLISFQPAGTGMNEIIAFFTNSFIQMDTQGWFVTRDHRVDVAYNKPQFRQALEYLNSLVAEGLLDPSSFSITQAQMRQIAENPGAEILGSTVMQSPSTIWAMTSERQRKYDAIAPMRGPGGVRYSVLHMGTQVTPGTLVITNQSRYPEVIMRWVDWFFDQEGLMTMRIGREGIEWKWAQPGELSYTGVQGLWHNIGAQGGSTNEFWMQYGMASYNRHTLQIGVFDDRFRGPEGLNTRLYVYSREQYHPFRPAYGLPPMYFELDVLNPIVQPLNDIVSFRNQQWARFISGDLALNDATWNTYINALNQMGLANVVTAYQRTYDTFRRNAAR
jgi:putative aldouronate transport system substrate-binding protein